LTAKPACETCGRPVPGEQALCEECRADWERSRVRWRTSPRKWAALTAGRILTGDAFIEKVAEYVDFDAEKNVLEIGPGYGRLLQAILDEGIPFGRYLGLDLAEGNCEYLRAQFPQANVSFVQGDVETASLGVEADVVISSMTFQHLYPTFERALRNLRRQLRPGAVVCIDLVEGIWRSLNEKDYLRSYTREEAVEILDRVGLEHVAFDEVQHRPDLSHLLMVARKLP
jgi:SAM-dependent methyltransferase